MAKEAYSHLGSRLQAPDADDKLLALANFKYSLVCTMPRLALKDAALTLEQVRCTHVSVMCPCYASGAGYVH